MSQVPDHYGARLPEGVIPPESYDDALEFYGWDPRFQKGEGVFVGWEAQMAVVKLPELLHYGGAPVATVRVHPKVKRWAEAALEEIHAKGMWHLLDPYGGSYNFRLQKGGTRLSAHCFGAGFDFDPARNPQFLKVAFDAARQMPVPMSLDGRQRIARFASDPRGPECVRVFEEWGWFWGGRFLTVPDAMHFQWGHSW